MLVHNFDCCISRFPGTFNCVDAARKKVKSSHARLIYIDYAFYFCYSAPDENISASIKLESAPDEKNPGHAYNCTVYILHYLQSKTQINIILCHTN